MVTIKSIYDLILIWTMGKRKHFMMFLKRDLKTLVKVFSNTGRFCTVLSVFRGYTLLVSPHSQGTL